MSSPTKRGCLLKKKKKKNGALNTQDLKANPRAGHWEIEVLLSSKNYLCVSSLAESLA